MEKKNIVLRTAATNAVLTTLYIALISSFLFYGTQFLGQTGKPDTILAPIVMLSLFVFSAAITSFLVFGRPILWYLDGMKKEALQLLAYTLAFFFAITVILLSLIFLISA
jgi:hypothetical protein